MSTYIFTDISGKKVIDIKIFDGKDPGDDAQDHRRKLGKSVIAWAHMGGDNPQIEIKKTDGRKK